MCKVFLIAGIKPSTSKKAWKFAETIAKPMSKINSDGLGYSAITANGEMFGERWLINSEAFTSVNDEVVNLDDKLFDEFGDAIGEAKKTPSKRGEYNNYGTNDRENTVAITMHTRYATAPKGMMNTHPFVDEGVSLIHNGQIYNADSIGLKSSTCDSESILRMYLKENVKADPNNFQTVADTLEGYYACGVLTQTDEGPILDIFKGNHAQLYVAYVKELETWVLCTSDDDIKSTCRELGYAFGEVYRILEGKFIRVDATTHKVKSTTPFKVGSSYKSSTLYNSNPHNTNTRNTANTMNIGDSGTKAAAKVFPFGPNKNPTRPMLDYFQSGKNDLVRFTERETQEWIASQEKVYNGY